MDFTKSKGPLDYIYGTQKGVDETYPNLFLQFSQLCKVYSFLQNLLIYQTELWTKAKKCAENINYLKPGEPT